MNQIYEQDCLDFLRSLPDGFVDLTFTDPPYNVKKDYGVYKDNKSQGEYIQWMQEIISECKRVSKRGIVFYVGSKLTELFFCLIPGSHLIPVHKRAAGVFLEIICYNIIQCFRLPSPSKKLRICGMM